MGRIITLLIAVLMTPVVIVFSSPDAMAQHRPGYTACTVKWVEAGRPNGWDQFMGNCLRSVQMVPERQTPNVLPQQPRQEQRPPLATQQTNPKAAAGSAQNPFPQPTKQQNDLASSQQDQMAKETKANDWKQKKLEDMTIEERANFLFPWAAQGDQRTQYIIDEMRASADRQQGNSYSLRVR